ncbi:hypothetical protein N8H41_25220, partial [Pseudomonas vlassakiae]|uniref:hypothetical protein n=1 Tax=Pseudomonas vlassakiae TaxID=485888 RepID=UPI0021C8F25D
RAFGYAEGVLRTLALQTPAFGLLKSQSASPELSRAQKQKQSKNRAKTEQKQSKNRAKTEQKQSRSSTAVNVV